MWVDTCHPSCLTCFGPAYNQCSTCPTNSVSYTAAYGLCRCKNGYIAKDYTCVLMTSCPVNYIEDKYKKTCDLTCQVQNCSTCSSYSYCTSCSAGYKNLYGQCVQKCPFYTVDDGTNCIDAIYDSFTYPSMVSQLFMNEQFTHAESYNTGFSTNARSYTMSNTIEMTNYAFFDCAGTSFAFGYQWANQDCSGGCTQSKTFTDLPAHYEAYVQVEIMSGDSWDSGTDFSKINIDGVQKDYYTRDHNSSPTCSDICGGFNGVNDCYHQVKIGPFGHKLTSLNFEIYFQAPTNLYDQWIGFRELSISLKGCMDVCGSCSNDTTCDTCIESRTNTPNCDQPADGYYDDGLGALKFPACDYKCATCSGTADNCLTCRDTNSPASTCDDYDSCLHWVKIDSGNFEHGKYHNVFIDGVNQGYATSRGIGISIFDNLGQFVEFINYDTSTSLTSVQAMTTKLNSITNGYYVLVGVNEDGGYELDPYAYVALRKVGLDSNTIIDYRDGFSMIGMAGTTPGTPPQKLNKRGDLANNAIVEACMIKCLTTCKTCGTRYDNCLSCDSPRFLNADTPTNNCIATCPDGRYGQTTPTRECVDCPTECATCTSSIVCQTCEAGYYFYNNFCYNPCPDGTYADTVSKTCKLCDVACKTCTDSTNADCIDCNDSPVYYLLASDSTCYSDCPGAHYEDSTTTPPSCQSCDSKCTLCYGSTSDDCTQCNTPTYELVGNSCVLNCDPECLTCQTTPSEDAAHCLSCDVPLYLQGTTCVSDCGAGQYEEDSTRTCELCDPKCATCTDLTTCQSCNNGFYLYANFCQDPCPNTYYGDSTTNTCESCQPLCATCEESTYLECTSCFSDRFLDAGQCMQCTDYLGYQSSAGDPLVCEEICGDGIRLTTEIQCDDGNNINGDGCSSTCQVEEDFKCSGGDATNPDKCYSISEITFTVYSEDGNTIYYNLYQNNEFSFILEFTQEFTLLNDATLEQLINVQVDGHPNIQNNVNILQTDLDGKVYNVNMIFGETVRERDLKVVFDHPEYFVNKDNINLLDEGRNLTVKDYFYYTDDQRAQTDEINRFVELFIVWLIVYVVIFLIINKFWMITNALDNMQLVFMTGFFNFRPPIDGYFFHKKIERLKDFYLPNLLDFDGENTPSDKFGYYGYSGNFLSNAGSIVQILLCLALVHLVIKLIIQQQKQQIQQQNQDEGFHSQRTLKRQSSQDSQSALKSLNFIIYNIFEFRLWNDFIQAFFGIIYFFALVNFISLKLQTSLFASIIFGVGVFVLLFAYIKVIKNNKYQPYNTQDLDEKEIKSLEFENEMQNPSYKFRTLWHQINLKNQSNMNWLIILLVKKIFQASVIVLLQSSAAAQVYLIMVQTILYIFYMIVKRPFLKIADNCHVVLTEFLVVIGVCMSIQMKNDISEDEITRYNKTLSIIGVYLASLIIHNIYLTIFILAYLYKFMNYLLCPERKQFRITNLREHRNNTINLKSKKEFDLLSTGTGAATGTHALNSLRSTRRNSKLNLNSRRNKNRTKNNTNSINLPMQQRLNSNSGYPNFTSNMNTQNNFDYKMGELEDDHNSNGVNSGRTINSKRFLNGNNLSQKHIQTKQPSISNLNQNYDDDLNFNEIKLNQNQSLRNFAGRKINQNRLKTQIHRNNGNNNSPYDNTVHNSSGSNGGSGSQLNSEQLKQNNYLNTMENYSNSPVNSNHNNGVPNQTEQNEKRYPRSAKQKRTYKTKLTIPNFSSGQNLQSFTQQQLDSNPNTHHTGRQPKFTQINFNLQNPVQTVFSDYEQDDNIVNYEDNINNNNFNNDTYFTKQSLETLENDKFSDVMSQNMSRTARHQSQKRLNQETKKSRFAFE